MSTREDPPRVVFDCMVFLRGLSRSYGAAGACLRLAESGTVRLCLSSEVLAELNDVLTRPKLQRKFPVLTPEFVEAALQRLLAAAEIVPDVPRVMEYPRDPKDEPYLNLGLAADARYLVTEDKDLLDLMVLTSPEARALRGQVPDLLILQPKALLDRLSGEPVSPELVE